MRSEPPMTYVVPLTFHPITNNPVVRAIAGSIAWSQYDTLILSYTLTGDCARLQIPDERPAAQVDGLWQHTCFEAFLAPKGDSAYWEFNFSPSSEWAMYQFRRYRDRIADNIVIAPPQIVTHRTVDRLTLDVRLHVPRLLTTQPLRVGLSAVIEDEHGTRSYWALQHPLEKPDFHHADAFVLEIVSPTIATAGKDRP